jgi:pimeloyl-ACP methyl ester carboxylesterase
LKELHRHCASVFVMAGKPLRDLIVLLPGITGSVLQKDRRDLWAVSGRAVWRTLISLGESLRELRLEGDDPGGIVATRVMRDAHLVPGLVKIDGYSAMARMITETFDILEGSVHEANPANFIEFPYDWRLDNRTTARQLRRLVEDRLQRWQEHSYNRNARVVIVAHSMGGLVARYYLEVLEGWRTCRALITFGTPYRGSLNSVNFLANGYKQLFLDLTEAMRSFPSVYQLLPIYPALRIGDEWHRVAEVGDLPGIEQVRAADALAFHREIESAVDEHRRDPDYLDRGYVILPVVGTKQPTLQSAVLTLPSRPATPADRGRITVGSELPPLIDAALGEGDGTVPRASAIPIELSNEYRETFVAERHAALQCNPFVLDDLRGRLMQMQVLKDMSKVRGSEESRAAAERPALALHVDDLYLAGEPVRLQARLINAPSSIGPLRARIESVDIIEGGSMRAVDFVESPDGWTLVLEGLPPGLYRVQARTAKAGPEAPLPVHDLFEVAG